VEDASTKDEIRGATAALVRWIARETIYVGQILIRTAYRWLRWADDE
jgi:hypothetical protein